MGTKMRFVGAAPTVAISLVMNPMAQARGLQLPRNDKGAASGCMTAARQNQSPAACAPSGAYVQHFTLATIPASNARMFGWEGGMCKPFALTAARVPKHMSSVPRNGGGGASPMPEGRGRRAERRVKVRTEKCPTDACRGGHQQLGNGQPVPGLSRRG